MQQFTCHETVTQFTALYLEEEDDLPKLASIVAGVYDEDKGVVYISKKHRYDVTQVARVGEYAVRNDRGHYRTYSPAEFHSTYAKHTSAANNYTYIWANVSVEGDRQNFDIAIQSSSVSDAIFEWKTFCIEKNLKSLAALDELNPRFIMTGLGLVCDVGDTFMSNSTVTIFKNGTSVFV